VLRPTPPTTSNPFGAVGTIYSVLPSSATSPPSTGHILLLPKKLCPGSRRRHTGDFQTVSERRRD
jgi:hypothetical protein